jgi:hypothetical protein
MTRVPWSRYEGDDIEAVVSMFVCREFPEAFRVRPSRGDGGIDVCVPLTDGHVEIYQVKKFTDHLNASQKSQIVESHNRIQDYAQRRGWTIGKWHLAIPLDPTPENTEWLEEVEASADFPCVWRGLATIEAWAAAHPDIIDYYLRDGRDRLAEELARFVAVSGIPVDGQLGMGTEEFAHLEPGMVESQLAALRTTLNQRDPHFLYDIAVADVPMEPAPKSGGYPALVASTFREIGDSYVTFHVRARGAESLQERPVTFRGEITARVGTAEQRELEEFQKFGRAPTVPLSINDFDVDLPGGLGGGFGSGTIVVTAPDDGETFQRRLAVLSPADETLAEVIFTMSPLSVNHDYTGAFNRGVDPSGFLSVETFAIAANGAFDMRIRLHPGDPSGHFPDKIEQSLALVHHFGSPNKMRIAALRGTGAAEQDLPPSSPDPEGSRWNNVLLRYVRALIAVQRYIPVELRVPDMAGESLENIHGVLRAARLVNGEDIEVTWDNARFALHPGVVPPDGLHQLSFQQDLIVKVGDLQINLGRLLVTTGPAEVNNLRTDDSGSVIAEFVPALGKNRASLRWMGAASIG